MQTILIFNIVVLAGLISFFFREECRFRRLSKKITETKNDLTSIVHQLRSPIANLRKYSEFLQSKEFGTLSFSQHEAMNKIQLSLGESLILLDRLLARSRLDEGKVTMQSAPLRLSDIVQGAVDAVMPIALEKKHRISMSGNGRITICTDPLLLHGIFDEILCNAIHYTSEGGEISIILTEKGTSVEIQIVDTGIGISKEESPHIFEKYFRGERAKPLFGGNGLGLPFAKKFTEQLGGDIRFRSKEGKGSTFTISLPKKMG